MPPHNHVITAHCGRITGHVGNPVTAKNLIHFQEADEINTIEI